MALDFSLQSIFNTLTRRKNAKKILEEEEEATKQLYEEELSAVVTNIAERWRKLRDLSAEDACVRAMYSFCDLHKTI